MNKSKIISLVAGILFLCAACSGCTPEPDGGSEENSQDNKCYITHFDNYHECLVFPTFFHGGPNWPYNEYNEGSAETDWNQKDKEYISEGEGSLYFRLLEGTFYIANIDANNYLTQYYDINGAKRISIDIYNPEQIPIHATIDVKSSEETMFSFDVVCMPESWTTLETDIEQRLYDYVDTYSLTLKNETNDNTFELYLDNFYLLF